MFTILVPLFSWKIIDKLTGSGLRMHYCTFKNDKMSFMPQTSTVLNLQQIAPISKFLITGSSAGQNILTSLLSVILHTQLSKVLAHWIKTMIISVQSKCSLAKINSQAKTATMRRRIIKPLGIRSTVTTNARVIDNLVSGMLASYCISWFVEDPSIKWN